MKTMFPIVMTDIALFTIHDRSLKVLLVQRQNEPASGEWALPGGILRPDIDPDLDGTAQRVLQSKTQVCVSHLEQVKTVSGPQRDPRGWSVCTLYFALLAYDRINAIRGNKTEAIEWCDARHPDRALAFDHASLLQAATNQLATKVDRYALPLQLLPQRFTLSDLQQACEAILGRPLDKSVFRRRLKSDLSLLPIPDAFLLGPQRPAQLYTAAPSFIF